jgi:photosystem II stability/assembly factor-like uncharacterized protein
MRALVVAASCVLVFALTACATAGHRSAARHHATTGCGATANSESIGQPDSLVVDPRNPCKVFAIGELIPSRESADGGAHWQTFSPLGVTVLSVAFDPVHPRTVYVGGDDGCGVFKSTNGGKSWRRAGLNGCTVYKLGRVKKYATGESISTLAVGPGGRVIYAGADLNLPRHYPALFKSSDAGHTWRKVSDAPAQIPILVLNPNGTQTLYTWTQGVVYKITDGGTRWHRLNMPGGGGVDTLAIDPRSNPQTVYAGGGGVLESRNGGKSWRQIGLEDQEVVALAISPSNPRTVYAGTMNGVFKSADAGSSWQLLGFDGQNVWSLGVAADGSVLYAGTDNGVTSLRLR